MNLHAVILAAGQGTRMRSSLPKVLHRVAGAPMLGHVLAAAHAAGAAHCHVVLGHGAQAVQAWLQTQDEPAVDVALQSQQLGTAHAVLQALPVIPDDAVVVVLYGDVPLITAPTLQRLAQAAATGLALVTATLDRPRGYGRILRNSDGCIGGIVEEKDASADQRAIREINAGLLAVPASRLRGWLAQIGNDNANGEYYLTDIVALAVRDGVEVSAVSADSVDEIEGVNDRAQLAAAERHFQQAQAGRLMADGLQLLDPQRFDLRGRLDFGRDVCVDVGCVFEGTVYLADNVSVGPYVVLRDVSISAGAQIKAHSVLESAVIGENCHIGPFARLRPGTRLAADVHVGNFVEIKNSTLATGAKAGHLAYVGDADVGARVNISAGVITCNYDGVNKHRTVIGDDAFIGSDSQLIAPVSVGERAYIAAGSTIARDAPGEVLTIARAREQRSLPNWRRPVKSDKKKP